MPCCTQTNGLGQLDPATLMAINEAFVHAKDLWNNLKQIFGIGVGAHEADVIVPLQNQIQTTVLAPISDFLTGYHNGSLTVSCSDCQTYLSQIKATETKWLKYLHETQWADGRAAHQAEATLQPYFTAMKSELEDCVKQKCGILPGTGIITNPDGSINWPIIALGAGAVYMLTRRKRA